MMTFKLWRPYDTKIKAYKELGLGLLRLIASQRPQTSKVNVTLWVVYRKCHQKKDIYIWRHLAWGNPTWKSPSPQPWGIPFWIPLLLELVTWWSVTGRIWIHWGDPPITSMSGMKKEGVPGALCAYGTEEYFMGKKWPSLGSTDRWWGLLFKHLRPKATKKWKIVSCFPSGNNDG